AHRLRLPPLIGYLIAGVLIGPATPGFVADQTLASEFAEIGVILLMFGVGLHFSLEDLQSVKSIAVPSAVVQIICATLLGMALAQWLGWSIGAGLVFGLALSVGSTVVRGGSFKSGAWSRPGGTASPSTGLGHMLDVGGEGRIGEDEIAELGRGDAVFL